MVELVNPQTGELHLIGIVRKPRFKVPFVLLFQKELLTVLKTVGRDLSGVQWSVLLLIMATTPFGNVSEKYVTELAAELDHPRSVVSKAITVLVGRQLITRTAGEGSRPAKLMLDPHLAFRGNVRERSEIIGTAWPWPARPEVEDPEAAA
jgi:MarR family